MYYNMAENSFKINSSYKLICKKILEISPKIRYVGITNKFGRTIAGQLRTGIVPFLKPEDMKNELFVHSMIYNIRKNYENAVGDIQFIMIASLNVDIVSFHIKDLIYYITLEKNIDKNELYPLIEKTRSVAQSNQISL
jgi:hypothetical protein